MATVLEIIRTISQAASCGNYDGAHDENFTADGKARKIGLKREEGHMINDSRVMDGFSVRFFGNKLRISYTTQLKVEEVYNPKFEDEINEMIENIASFLKKEYKSISGETLSLKRVSESDILVQNMSNVRMWAQAHCDYEIGNLSGVIDSSDNDRNLDSAIKDFLGSARTGAS